MGRGLLSATPPPPPLTQLNDMLPLIVSSRNFSRTCVQVVGDIAKSDGVNKFVMPMTVSFLSLIMESCQGVDFQRAMQWQLVE